MCMNLSFRAAILLGIGVAFPATSGRVLAGEPATPPLPGSAPTANPTQTAAPTINIETSVYDFGKVLCGETVKHDYVVKNTGAGTLIISNVQSSCGCTTATNTSKEISPGKQGLISIEFHTANFSGPVKKTLAVTSNDPNKPLVNIQVKGTVWKPIEVTPPAASFMSRLDSPTNEIRVVHILNQQDQPLILSPPQSNQRTVGVELKTNHIGKEYEVLVRLVPPLGAGNTFAQITLKTSSPQMPVLTIPVFAVAQVRK